MEEVLQDGKEGTLGDGLEQLVLHNQKVGIE